MRSATIMLTVGLALLGWAGSGYAQRSGGGSSPPTPPSPFTPPNLSCGPTLAHAPSCALPLMNQLVLYGTEREHLNERARQGNEDTKEFALKESERLIKELSLPCELADAERAGGGKIDVDGKSVDVKVYEAACRSGTGYFLVSQPPQKSLAVSCLAAEASRVADVSKGAPPDDFACTLGGFKDVKKMAASMLQRAGTVCDVSEYRWMGVSSVSGMEYSEVACADGHGYVLESPKTGPAAHLAVVGCQDAVNEGVKCTLTAVTMPVTLQTFRDAIKEHAVDCAPVQIRYVGRETTGRRYVVELECPQQPKGLVAFIPLEGNPKPFETVDCHAAIARAVRCTLTAKQ